MLGPVELLEAQTVDLPISLNGVGLEERLGDNIPENASFVDAEGNEVQIGDYLDGSTPLILNFVYHDCPMLCSIALESFGETLKRLDLGVGNEFDILTLSIGAGETPEMAANAKARMIGKLQTDEAEQGWHFLTGDESNIRTLTDAVGYNFKWVESSQEYAHPATLIFVSGDGVVTRYLHGIDFPVADMKMAIVEASEGEVGTPLDQFVLYCLRYDSNANSYVLHASNLMRLGGFLTLMMIGVGLAVYWRRERSKQEQRFTRT